MDDITTKNIDFKKRIHYEANKYLDILTIIQQLEKNGFVDKIYDMLGKIYEEEHKFTLAELKKIAKKARSEGEEFDFVDRYNSNSSVFKQNLVAILEMFVETIWNAKMNKVQKVVQDYTEEEINNLLEVKRTDLDRVGYNENLNFNLKPDLRAYFYTDEEKKQKTITKLKKDHESKATVFGAAYSKKVTLSLTKNAVNKSLISSNPKKTTQISKSPKQAVHSQREVGGVAKSSLFDKKDVGSYYNRGNQKRAI